MKISSLVPLAVAVLILTGCTEMRVEGDAKVFQSSATGSILGTLLGLGLLVLGGASLLGSFWPDRKPRNAYEAKHGATPTSMRIGLGLFGFGMGFMGFFLTIISLLFSKSLHVTVYPDRVVMASTYSQAGGKEVVVPYSNLKSVELQEEFNIGRKRNHYLVFTLKDGNLIKQNAGNNERQALDTIQQTFADYKARPVVAEQPKPAAIPTKNEPKRPAAQPTASDTAASSEDAAAMIVGTLQTSPSPTTATAKPVAPGRPARPMTPGGKYQVKRYPVNIPVSAGYSIVGPSTPVQVGQKLQACFASNWEPVTVVEVNEDGTITCNWDNWKGFTYMMFREDLAIGQGTAIGSGGQSAIGVQPLPLPQPQTAPSRSQYALKRYLINIPVQPGYANVKADTEVKVGMKLGACYAGRWESVTVVELNSDGTITCNWDKWSGFTYKMMREDLIIKK